MLKSEGGDGGGGGGVGRTIADHRKDCLILEITHSFSRDNVAACEQGQSSRWQKGQSQPDHRGRQASAVLPKPTTSPPSASGLFVTEPRAAYFRREANRFRDLLLPGLQHAFIKYFREQKATSKARAPCSCCGWRLELGEWPSQWLRNSIPFLFIYSFILFLSSLSMVPISFKTETWPINGESIKGQRNCDIGTREKTEAGKP